MKVHEVFVYALDISAGAHAWIYTGTSRKMLLSYSIVSVISDNCALHRSFGSSLDGG